MSDINRRYKRKEKEWVLKSDIDVKKILDQIRIERIKKGLDNDILPYREMISASFRFEPLIDVLKKAQIKRKYER